MKRLLSLILAVVMVLALAVPAMAAEDEPVTVTVGSTLSRFVGNFDLCQLTSDQLSMPAAYLTYDTVLRIEVMEDGSSDYYSDILEDIYVDDAHENLIMVLKPGVYFSNGEEMDGYDLIYSLKRKGMHTRLYNDYLMFDFDNATVDGYTTTVPLNSYRGDWKLKLEQAVVMNKDWIVEHGGEPDPADASGEPFDWNDPALVCGSGPYKVTEYVVDDHVTYEKRDDWWQADTADPAVAQPDVIITKAYSDVSTMMVDYQNGVLDAVLNIGETQYNQINSDPSLGTAVATTAKSVVYIVLDVDNTPELADVELRKAIAMGTNIEDLAIVGYGDLAIIPEGMFTMECPFGSEGYTFEYDPDTAKQMVSDLGYEGLTLPMIADSSVSDMAEVWQEQMRQIGINIDLQVFDVLTCIQKWLTPGDSAFQFLGNDNANSPGDPSTAMSNLCAGTDLACLRKLDPVWNELVVKAQNGDTDEERHASYDELQDYNMENVYVIPVVEWESCYAFGASGVVKDIIMVNPENCNIRRIVVE